MTYELAKELVDEGFQKPEHPKGQMLCAPHNIHDRSLEVYEPTLSELIEACGSPYLKLEFPFPPAPRPNGNWFALSKNETAKGWVEHKGRGTTPEEAVARLWLALNPK